MGGDLTKSMIFLMLLAKLCLFKYLQKGWKIKT